ncbi:MAG: hypothetical protein WCQ50_14665 [Spirochaetota bacterium]
MKSRLKPDLGNLFKFFRSPEHALSLLNERQLHFINPAKYEATIGEVNWGIGRDLQRFRVKNVGVSCFSMDEDCWTDKGLWNEFADGGNGVLVGFQESARRSGDGLAFDFQEKAWVMLARYVDDGRDPVDFPEIDDFPNDGLFYVPVKQPGHRSESEYRLCVFGDFDTAGRCIEVGWSSFFYPKAVVFHHSASSDFIADFCSKIRCARSLRTWHSTGSEIVLCGLSQAHKDN